VLPHRRHQRIGAAGLAHDLKTGLGQQWRGLILKRVRSAKNSDPLMRIVKVRQDRGTDCKE
jgi:hypothetical protein